MKMNAVELAPGIVCPVIRSHVQDGKFVIEIQLPQLSRWEALRVITHNFVVPWYKFPGLFWRAIVR